MAKISSWGRGALDASPKRQVLHGRGPAPLISWHGEPSWLCRRGEGRQGHGRGRAASRGTTTLLLLLLLHRAAEPRPGAWRKAPAPALAASLCQVPAADGSAGCAGWF